MSAAREVTRAVLAPVAAARPAAPLAGADASAASRRLAARLGDAWLARAAWTAGRTGRAGLAGIALLLASALFLLSTHLRVVSEVHALRVDLAAARGQAHAVAARREADEAADPARALSGLPAREELPAILRQLFRNASQARLSVDTAKYEVDATRTAGVVRCRVAFPVSGPYPAIRSFLDASLATMPAVALSDLALSRRSISDGAVEAQVRLTIYARSEP